MQNFTSDNHEDGLNSQAAQVQSSRRPWVTPMVIETGLDNTHFNITGGLSDASGGATPAS